MDHNNLMTQLQDKILNLINVQMKWEETADKLERDKEITQSAYRTHALLLYSYVDSGFVSWHVRTCPQGLVHPGTYSMQRRWHEMGALMVWPKLCRFYCTSTMKMNHDSPVTVLIKTDSIARLILSKLKISFWIGLWTIVLQTRYFFISHFGLILGKNKLSLFDCKSK